MRNATGTLWVGRRKRWQISAAISTRHKLIGTRLQTWQFCGPTECTVVLIAGQALFYSLGLDGKIHVDDFFAPLKFCTFKTEREREIKQRRSREGLLVSYVLDSRGIGKSTLRREWGPLLISLPPLINRCGSIQTRKRMVGCQKVANCPPRTPYSPPPPPSLSRKEEEKDEETALGRRRKGFGRRRKRLGMQQNSTLGGGGALLDERENCISYFLLLLLLSRKNSFSCVFFSFVMHHRRGVKKGGGGGKNLHNPHRLNTVVKIGGFSHSPSSKWRPTTKQKFPSPLFFLPLAWWLWATWVFCWEGLGHGRWSSPFLFYFQLPGSPPWFLVFLPPPSILNPPPLFGPVRPAWDAAGDGTAILSVLRREYEGVLSGRTCYSNCKQQPGLKFWEFQMWYNKQDTCFPPRFNKQFLFFKKDQPFRRVLAPNSFWATTAQKSKPICHDRAPAQPSIVYKPAGLGSAIVPVCQLTVRG